MNAVLPTVTPVVTAIRDHGVSAALDYGEQFDHVRPESLQVPSTVIDQAVADLDPDLRAALEESIARVHAVHADQKPQPHTTELTAGGTVTEIFQPIARVGLYVPGGNAVYPSSVIMNVVPAQEAGVTSLVVASPPQADHNGWPHPTILAACGLLGVTEVWAVGGAQAVALMVYGDTDLEPVDMITGPGNIYVTAAKRLVRGVVGIDAEAGPTEIAIIADADADPDYIAADMVSQAEHDPAAASVLITDSTALADAVEGRMSERAARTKHSERVREALGGPQSGIVIVDTVGAAIDVANAYGPEHLEIHTRHVNRDAKRIRNAGAIFVGPYTPVPLGDYLAGSNHVLPTGGTARFASGLNVHSFLKAVQEIEYTKEAAAGLYEPLRRMSADEDLPAHAEALQARID